MISNAALGFVLATTHHLHGQHINQLLLGLSFYILAGGVCAYTLRKAIQQTSSQSIGVTIKDILGILRESPPASPPLQGEGQGEDGALSLSNGVTPSPLPPISNLADRIKCQQERTQNLPFEFPFTPGSNLSCFMLRQPQHVTTPNTVRPEASSALAALAAAAGPTAPTHFPHSFGVGLH